MIYLFDEKRNRQLDYSWSKEKLEKYKDLLIPVYTYVEVEKNNYLEKILMKGNTVIVHESFFDNTIVANSLEIRRKLRTFSTENKEFNLVFFSGSKNSRKLIDNEASIPVSIMYQNLEIFLKKKCDTMTVATGTNT